MKVIGNEPPTPEKIRNLQRKLYGRAKAEPECVAGVSVVVHAMAQARGVLDEHAIKQIDRLMSNQGVEPWRMFGPWVTEVVGERKAVVVAMDWTDFDVDDQTTLALSLVTRHGRATPLVWLTVFKAELKDKRNHYEDLYLARLAEAPPKEVWRIAVSATPNSSPI